jgi:hypothetical protein
MEAYVQTAIGIVVSVGLFLIGYRQTIGARKERAKNANQSVHRAVLRRMVLEDYTPGYEDLTRLLEGKAREFQVPVNDLLSEDQMLNSLYTEVFDSDLISPNQRQEIEGRLIKLFDDLERSSERTPFPDFSLLRAEKKQSVDHIFRMAAAASIAGAGSSLFYKFLQDPDAIDPQWLLSGLGVLIASIAAVSATVIFKKSREAEISISRSSSYIEAANFELELAKLIEKSNLHYKAQPMIGGFRPDFLVELGAENVVVEAKSWDDNVPLAKIKSAIKYLHKLTEAPGVDRAILVSKKRPPVRGFESGDSKILVLSQAEFSSYIKKHAA